MIVGSRPHDPEMVGLARVELATRSLGNCCSIHLSYSPVLNMPLFYIDLRRLHGPFQALQCSENCGAYSERKYKG